MGIYCSFFSNKKSVSSEDKEIAEKLVIEYGNNLQKTKKLIDKYDNDTIIKKVSLYQEEFDKWFDFYEEYSTSFEFHEALTRFNSCYVEWSSLFNLLGDFDTLSKTSEPKDFNYKETLEILLTYHDEMTTSGELLKGFLEMVIESRNYHDKISVMVINNEFDFYYERIYSEHDIIRIEDANYHLFKTKESIYEYLDEVKDVRIGFLMDGVWVSNYSNIKNNSPEFILLLKTEIEKLFKENKDLVVIID